ncbi:MAG: NAD kinase [Bifidobacteriaceae bacterium]|jgi:NAD+ kinase|nr:NAD kinase [Bifidobacteriaceae bacterium]MCI1978141.1 NAD kinase [Bifidobacteriaceae bacterium]
MTSKRSVIVVTHRRLTADGSTVSEVIDQLKHAGFDVSLNDNLEAAPLGSPLPLVDPDTELLVVLGGDGTILRAAELVKGTSVPILGINMGHVGFLAEFESFQTSEAIRKIADHDYQIDERTLAGVQVNLPGSTEPLYDWALNDVTIEKADRGKMVELGIKVDGVEMSSFGADGVIVATPTGSTAYAFSAGGPIIWPTVASLQLVPLAAHALFARSLVIGSESNFRIDVLPSSDAEGWISCDGRRSLQLPRGASVVVAQSQDTLKLARLSGVPFTQRLVTKFDLPVVGWREQRHHQAGGSWSRHTDTGGFHEGASS